EDRHRAGHEPRHRPHRPPVVTRLEVDLALRGEPPGLLLAVGPALVAEGAHDRALKRRAHGGPLDGPARLQHGAGLEPEDLTGRRAVDQHRIGLDEAAEGLGVRLPDAQFGTSLPSDGWTAFGLWSPSPTDRRPSAFGRGEGEAGTTGSRVISRS